MMAKKESPEEQFERFRKTVQDMVDAGELSPTEAEERFERSMETLLKPPMRDGNGHEPGDSER